MKAKEKNETKVLNPSVAKSKAPNAPNVIEPYELDWRQTTAGVYARKAERLAEKIRTVKDLRNADRIAKKIQFDVSFGIYENFPKLKDTLWSLSEGLFISNRELTQLDILVLLENEYL